MSLRPHVMLSRFLYNSRMRILFLGLILILICVTFIITYSQKSDMSMCFRDRLDASAAPPSVVDPKVPRSLEDVLLTEPKPVPGRSIFFHETSCHLTHARSQHNLLQITARQACAIESAAMHNPNFEIFVLFAGPTYHLPGNSSGQPLIDAILSYKNVHLRKLNLWRYAEGTPMEQWLNDGKLFRSRYLFSHISDFLRYLTLYRFGGIYLDMDIVMLRSMEEVPPNYTGAESTTHLAAGIMSLASNGFGHEIAELCLRDFQKHFDGNDWGNNGPGVITRVAQQICATKDITLMVDDSKRCLGFKVFDRSAFYAVPWKNWRYFFEPQYLEQTLAATKHSYVVHVWNKHSKQLPLQVGTKGAYGIYAEQNCPKAYAAAGKYF